ncbi:hypothetical protein KJ840_02885 [Patescibacteria group bacterium]|nr:hypothetical protein [Patescibacteria group bacterium]
MINGKVLFGIIVLIVGIWILFSMDNPTARYLGGGIVTVVGLAMLINGFLKKPQPPQNQQGGQQ